MQIDNHALCEKHNIAIYRVSDVYTEDEAGMPIPPEKLNMFMVATIVGKFDSATLEAIPLAATVVEAEALAVTHLNLK